MKPLFSCYCLCYKNNKTLSYCLIVEVSWCYISAKTWGPKTKPQVLAIHGLNDNAASFDQLIPQLSDKLCVVCMDLPGHGLSAHLPPGLLPSLLDHVTALRHVVDHLQWQQFSLLAHSLGSHVAIYFCSLFGQQVTRLLLIDAFFANIIPEAKFTLERCQVTFDKVSKIDGRTRSTYTYHETLLKLNESRNTKLALHCIKALQKRAFKETESGYISNNDERIKLLTYPLITPDFHISLVKAVDCQVMVISTTEFEPFLMTPATKDTLDKLREKLGSKMKTVKIQGCHDIHMDQPQAIVPLVTRFFVQPGSHL